TTHARTSTRSGEKRCMSSSRESRGRGLPVIAACVGARKCPFRVGAESSHLHVAVCFAREGHRHRRGAASHLRAWRASLRVREEGPVLRRADDALRRHGGARLRRLPLAGAGRRLRAAGSPRPRPPSRQARDRGAPLSPPCRGVLGRLRLDRVTTRRTELGRSTYWTASCSTTKRSCASCC